MTRKPKTLANVNVAGRFLHAVDARTIFSPSLCSVQSREHQPACRENIGNASISGAAPFRSPSHTTRRTIYGSRSRWFQATKQPSNPRPSDEAGAPRKQESQATTSKLSPAVSINHLALKNRHVRLYRKTRSRASQTAHKTGR